MSLQVKPLRYRLKTRRFPIGRIQTLPVLQTAVADRRRVLGRQDALAYLRTNSPSPNVLVRC